MEDAFSEESSNLGDDEISPVEHPHQTHEWPDGRPSWDSLLNVVRNQQRRRQHRPYPSPGYVEVFGNLPMSSAIMTNGYPRKIQIQQLCHFRIPIHLIQSLITFDDTALARVYTDYRDAARHLLASGVPNEEVSGPASYARPSEMLQSLFNWPACIFLLTLCEYVTQTVIRTSNPCTDILVSGRSHQRKRHTPRCHK
jgi:hypothetical protein